MKPCCKCGKEVMGAKLICKECHDWTPVEESLPPPNQQVLCWTKSEYFVLDSHDGQTFFGRTITHWKPLDTPPGGKR